MSSTENDAAAQMPTISTQAPYLPPTTTQQALNALLSEQGFMGTLMAQPQFHSGLAAGLLGYPMPSSARPGLAGGLAGGYFNALRSVAMSNPAYSVNSSGPGLAGALERAGIQSIPGADPRLVNISTDQDSPEFQTANGTTIRINHPAPRTVLPWGSGLDRLIKFADATNAPMVTINGGAEGHGHSSNPLDAHPSNRAIDVAYDPNLSDDTLKQAALAAGYTHGIREIKDGAVHYHFQVGPENIMGDPQLFDLDNFGPIRPKAYTKTLSAVPPQGTLP